MLILMLGLLQTASMPPIATADPGQTSETIVVVGRVPKETGAMLANCLAWGCPPKEDIALSLAHAQAQFVAGDYSASRRTLTQARGRNRRFAAQLPEDVSQLHRANTRIADLVGLVDEARTGVFDIVDSLKAGLGNKDRRVLLARLEVGMAFARTGRTRAAFDEYNAVVRLARKAGDRSLEGLALFRRAVLLAAIASVNYETIAVARRATALLTTSSEPSWQAYRDALRVVPVMLAPRDKRAALLDQVTREMEPRPADRLLLLYAPAVDLGSAATLAGETTEWLDLRFTIARNGTVADVRMVRASSRVKEPWVQAATQALRQRRYTPLLLEDGEAEPQRTERISFVSDLLIEWNSRTFGRTANRRAVAQGLEERTLGER